MKPWRIVVLLVVAAITIGLVDGYLSVARAGDFDPAEIELNGWAESQEKQIFQGCAFKSEMVFYAAQQKLYARGNVNKLLAYLKDNMSGAEYRINEQFMRWIGEWVDGRQYDTAHEFSAQLFAECVSNSYQHFQISPTEHAEFMMRLFYEQLDATEERLLPQDAESDVSA